MRTKWTAASLVALLWLPGLLAAEEKPAQAPAEQPKPAAQEGEPAAGTEPEAKPAAGESKPMAQVGDRTITEADVQGLVGIQVSRMWAKFDQEVQQARTTLTNQEANLKSAGLDELVARALVEREAKARGISVEEFTKAEVDEKVGVTPEEAKILYDAQKDRMPELQNKSEEEGLKVVAEKIRQQRIGERRQALIRELRAKGGVRMLFEPPRVEVAADDDPVRGPQDAPITLVEFSDFQCPYCGRVEPTIKKIEERYGDKLRLVFRDYPLSMHPFAAKAAEAGSCAKEQGKFWEFHDVLFANQQRLAVEDLKKHAATAGLDVDAFSKCLDSGKYDAEWRKDLADGNKAGVNGTPAFFINGRFVNGAMPLDKFTAIIDDELERKGIAPPPPVAPGTANAAADR